MRQQRRDVVEQDARLGEVRDLADMGLEIHARSSRAEPCRRTVIARPRPRANPPGAAPCCWLRRWPWLALPLPRATAFAPDELVIETGQAAHRFTIELAATPGERARGLMYRQSMRPDHGMLFDFQTQQPVGVLDEEHAVAAGHAVHRRARAPSSRSLPTPRRSRRRRSSASEPIRAVLELNAGTAAKLRDRARGQGAPPDLRRHGLSAIPFRAAPCLSTRADGR